MLNYRVVNECTFFSKYITRTNILYSKIDLSFQTIRRYINDIYLFDRDVNKVVENKLTHHSLRIFENSAGADPRSQNNGGTTWPQIAPYEDSRLYRSMINPHVSCGAFLSMCLSCRSRRCHKTAMCLPVEELAGYKRCHMYGAIFELLLGKLDDWFLWAFLLDRFIFIRIFSNHSI